MALLSCLLVYVGGRRSQRLGPSPTLRSLGPSHQRHHKSHVSLRGPPCAQGVSGTPHGEVHDSNDGFVRDNLHNTEVWLDLNSELRDVIYPPPGARVQEPWFMEPTLETLVACPAPTTSFRLQQISRAPLPPNQHYAEPAATPFIDLATDEDDEPQAPPARTNKRTHAQMADGHHIFHSIRQFGTQNMKQSVHDNGHAPNLARTTRPSIAATKELLLTPFV